jgi:riboflavin synthase
MFTGLIEDIGEIVALRRSGGVHEISIRTQLPSESLRSGDSVAVHGVCLTLIEKVEGNGILRVQAVPESLSRSSLKSVRVGDRVHLERALGVGDRLGGHLVQGHVDGIGRIRHVGRRGGEWTLDVVVPRQWMRFIVEKGSISIDGVSLTVGRIGAEWFRVHIIPATAERTLLTGYRVGREVNLEIDVIAKYVDSLLGGFRS